MLKNPATGDYLQKLFKEHSAHSVDAALRAIYDLGAADADRQMSEEIGGPTTTIYGPSGPDAPFVPTSATPDKPTVW
jgi:hypothetical protein